MKKKEVVNRLEQILIKELNDHDRVFIEVCTKGLTRTLKSFGLTEKTDEDLSGSPKNEIIELFTDFMEARAAHSKVKHNGKIYDKVPASVVNIAIAALNSIDFRSDAKHAAESPTQSAAAEASETATSTQKSKP